MSELKAYKGDVTIPVYGTIADAEVYLKSEADKVIEDLEESHKNEVEQLLIEIVKLKEKRDTAEKLLNKALDCVSNGKNHMMSLARKKNHADYKRCLAMANWCKDKIDAIKNGYMVSSINTQYGVMTTCPPECNPKFSFYKRWYNRWLEFAEKFKEAK